MLHYIILIQYTYYVTFDMIYGKMIDIQSEMYYIHTTYYLCVLYTKSTTAFLSETQELRPLKSIGSTRWLFGPALRGILTSSCTPAS